MVVHLRHACGFFLFITIFLQTLCTSHAQNTVFNFKQNTVKYFSRRLCVRLSMSN